MGNSIFVGRVSQWKLNLLTFVTLLVVSVTNQYAQDGQLSQLGVMIFAYLLTMIIGLIIALATEPTRHE
ncbi:MAG: hypothetical protein CMB80_05355 [Flammeovirgaceae bacterium]|nr:hypothetical protein [Flammeovirgaceae bacterium]